MLTTARQAMMLRRAPWRTALAWTPRSDDNDNTNSVCVHSGNRDQECHRRYLHAPTFLSHPPAHQSVLLLPLSTTTPTPNTRSYHTTVVHPILPLIGAAVLGGLGYVVYRKSQGKEIRPESAAEAQEAYRTQQGQFSTKQFQQRQQQKQQRGRPENPEIADAATVGGGDDSTKEGAREETR